MSADAVIELASRDTVHLIHITCADCKNAVMAVVTVSALGMSSVGLYTDLSAADAAVFANAEPITDDDVLAWHEALKHNAAAFSEEVAALVPHRDIALVPTRE